MSAVCPESMGSAMSAAGVAASLPRVARVGGGGGGARSRSPRPQTSPRTSNNSLDTIVSRSTSPAASAMAEAATEEEEVTDVRSSSSSSSSSSPAAAMVAPSSSSQGDVDNAYFLQELIRIAVELKSTLSPNTEKALRLRAALSGLLDDLRVLSSANNNERLSCTPRVVLTARSGSDVDGGGKTAALQLLLPTYTSGGDAGPCGSLSYAAAMGAGMAGLAGCLSTSAMPCLVRVDSLGMISPGVLTPSFANSPQSTSLGQGPGVAGLMGESPPSGSIAPGQGTPNGHSPGTSAELGRFLSPNPSPAANDDAIRERLGKETGGAAPVHRAPHLTPLTPTTRGALTGRGTTPPPPLPAYHPPAAKSAGTAQNQPGPCANRTTGGSNSNSRERLRLDVTLPVSSDLMDAATPSLATLPAVVVVGDQHHRHRHRHSGGGSTGLVQRDTRLGGGQPPSLRHEADEQERDGGHDGDMRLPSIVATTVCARSGGEPDTAATCTDTLPRAWYPTGPTTPPHPHPSRPANCGATGTSLGDTGGGRGAVEPPPPRVPTPALAAAPACRLGASSSPLGVPNGRGPREQDPPVPLPRTGTTAAASFTTTPILSPTAFTSLGGRFAANANGSGSANPSDGHVDSGELSASRRARHCPSPLRLRLSRGGTPSQSLTGSPRGMPWPPPLSGSVTPMPTSPQLLSSAGGSRCGRVRRRSVTVLPGAFAVTVVDRARALAREGRLPLAPPQPSLDDTAAPENVPPLAHAETNLYLDNDDLSDTTNSDDDGGDNARSARRQRRSEKFTTTKVSWLLQDAVDEGAVRSEGNRFASYTPDTYPQVPMTTMGDATCLCVPCWEVGRASLEDTLALLFGPFAADPLDPPTTATGALGRKGPSTATAADGASSAVGSPSSPTPSLPPRPPSRTAFGNSTRREGSPRTAHMTAAATTTTTTSSPSLAPFSAFVPSPLPEPMPGGPVEGTARPRSGQRPEEGMTAPHSPHTPPFPHTTPGPRRATPALASHSRECAAAADHASTRAEGPGGTRRLRHVRGLRQAIAAHSFFILTHSELVYNHQTSGPAWVAPTTQARPRSGQPPSPPSRAAAVSSFEEARQEGNTPGALRPTLASPNSPAPPVSPVPPPPTVDSVAELVSAFREQVRRTFQVEVAEWQVVPFSGRDSLLTRDLLSSAVALALYPKQDGSPAAQPPPQPQQQPVLPRGRDHGQRLGASQSGSEEADTLSFTVSSSFAAGANPRASSTSTSVAPREEDAITTMLTSMGYPPLPQQQQQQHARVDSNSAIVSGGGGGAGSMGRDDHTESELAQRPPRSGTLPATTINFRMDDSDEEDGAGGAATPPPQQSTPKPSSLSPFATVGGASSPPLPPCGPRRAEPQGTASPSPPLCAVSPNNSSTSAPYSNFLAKAAADSNHVSGGTAASTDFLSPGGALCFPTPPPSGAAAAAGVVGSPAPVPFAALPRAIATNQLTEAVRRYERFLLPDAATATATAEADRPEEEGAKGEATSPPLTARVFQHALAEAWPRSGAAQLLATFNSFEHNAYSYLLSQAAVSLMLWAAQLAPLLPVAAAATEQRLHRTRLRHDSLARKMGQVEASRQQLTSTASPASAAARARLSIQEAFTRVVEAFLRDLRVVVVLQEEPREIDVGVTTDLRVAHERLRRSVSSFRHMYVEKDWEGSYDRVRQQLAALEQSHKEKAERYLDEHATVKAELAASRQTAVSSASASPRVCSPVTELEERSGSTPQMTAFSPSDEVDRSLRGKERARELAVLRARVSSEADPGYLSKRKRLLQSRGELEYQLVASLSQLNTEIINFFTATVVTQMPYIASEAEHETAAVARAYDGFTHALHRCMRRHRKGSQPHSLRRGSGKAGGLSASTGSIAAAATAAGAPHRQSAALSDIAHAVSDLPRMTLLSLPAIPRLEAFTTAFRAALCEDQVRALARFRQELAARGGGGDSDAGKPVAVSRRDGGGQEATPAPCATLGQSPVLAQTFLTAISGISSETVGDEAGLSSPPPPSAPPQRPRTTAEDFFLPPLLERRRGDTEQQQQQQRRRKRCDGSPPVREMTEEPMGTAYGESMLSPLFAPASRANHRTPSPLPGPSPPQSPLDDNKERRGNVEGGGARAKPSSDRRARTYTLAARTTHLLRRWQSEYTRSTPHSARYGGNSASKRGSGKVTPQGGRPTGPHGRSPSWRGSGGSNASSFRFQAAGTHYTGSSSATANINANNKSNSNHNGSGVEVDGRYTGVDGGDAEHRFVRADTTDHITSRNSEGGRPSSAATMDGLGLSRDSSARMDPFFAIEDDAAGALPFPFLTNANSRPKPNHRHPRHPGSNDSSSAPDNVGSLISLFSTFTGDDTIAGAGGHSGSFYTVGSGGGGDDGTPPENVLGMRRKQTAWYADSQLPDGGEKDLRSDADDAGDATAASPVRPREDPVARVEELWLRQLHRWRQLRTPPELRPQHFADHPALWVLLDVWEEAMLPMCAAPWLHYHHGRFAAALNHVGGELFYTQSACLEQLAQETAAAETEVAMLAAELAWLRGEHALSSRGGSSAQCGLEGEDRLPEGPPPEKLNATVPSPPTPPAAADDEPMTAQDTVEDVFTRAQDIAEHLGAARARCFTAELAKCQHGVGERE